MTFVLGSQNVFDFLVEQSICNVEDKAQCEIEHKSAKNFNLLLTLPGDRQLLVKQERRNRDGNTSGEFLREWQIQEFLHRFPELSEMRFWLSEGIYFHPEYSIIVLNYLNNYHDLMDFYATENLFPLQIATSIGTILAKIHRLTFNSQDYQDFFSQNQDNQSPDIVTHLVRNLERIGPEIFGSVPADGLKFFSLYQRYDSLGQAIAELGSSLAPCCLTHNDLKLNNILLSNDWQQAKSPLVRFIDWERCGWGDPAFDLGTLIGSYLLMWMKSLITSKTMSIDESLRMATTPLELLQPSLAALAIAYTAEFPQILQRRPDFMRRVVQYSGWMLITAIQSRLQYQKSFGNMDICMLQVAKSLLCRPEQSIPTIFGMEASALGIESMAIAV
ncbi:aminoglycoside phosphotransferase [Nostoc minutum NIES-26]|uniref:Aminoglycoside phosphotransferase n=1 Tax=Nostoc minutum NIES-26 TaxID=1844469 RepID=A0A367RYE5_9NOSO|nr:aminoglycoside phosphotransferase [Nostoc minutum NIES-26]